MNITKSAPHSTPPAVGARRGLDAPSKASSSTPKTESTPPPSSRDNGRSQKDLMYDWIIEAMACLSPEGASLSQIFSIIWSKKKSLIMARSKEGDREEKRITSTKSTIANYLSMSPSFETRGRNRWILTRNAKEGEDVSAAAKGSMKRKSNDDDEPYDPKPKRSRTVSSPRTTRKASRSAWRTYHPPAASTGSSDVPVGVSVVSAPSKQFEHHKSVPLEQPPLASDSVTAAVGVSSWELPGVYDETPVPHGVHDNNSLSLVHSLGYYPHSYTSSYVDASHHAISAPTQEPTSYSSEPHLHDSSAFSYDQSNLSGVSETRSSSRDVSWNSYMTNALDYLQSPETQPGLTNWWDHGSPTTTPSDSTGLTVSPSDRTYDPWSS